MARHKMAIVQFPSMRVTEITDARVFAQQVGPWLALREAENCYILGDLGDMAARANNPGPKPRLFVLTEGNFFASAAVLYTEGTLMITWCTLEMVNAWSAGLADLRCDIKRVFAPGYTAKCFSKQWAERFRMSREIVQEERIYQLAQLAHEPPSEGRLELAAPADGPMIRQWLDGFSRQTDYGVVGPELDGVRDELISRKQLYLWKDTQARGMAAWVRPTPHGASINFVFVPEEFRGKGYGKAVVSALAKQMLGSGLRYCFILTGAGDRRNNNLYQSVGARTVSELVLWKLTPCVQPAVTTTPAGFRFNL